MKSGRERLVELTTEAWDEYLHLSNEAEQAKAKWREAGDRVRAFDAAQGVFRAGVRCYSNWCGADLEGQPIRHGGHPSGPGYSWGPACEKHANNS